MIGKLDPDLDLLWAICSCSVKLGSGEIRVEEYGEVFGQNELRCLASDVGRDYHAGEVSVGEI